MQFPFHVILASKSPRRKELLAHLVPQFEIKTKDIEEVYPPNLATKDVPLFLAELKAEAFLSELKNGEVMISSDTIVCLENTIFGKPKDREDAIAILQNLSGKIHQVITGVCILSLEKKVLFSETTQVYFKPLSNDEITYYVDTFHPYDKAGAYAIQEWIGMIGIEKIEGDYFNVVGLPLFQLQKALHNF